MMIFKEPGILQIKYPKMFSQIHPEHIQRLLIFSKEYASVICSNPYALDLQELLKQEAVSNGKSQSAHVRYLTDH